jgi:uncharacterized protein (TIGR00106 family)
MKESIIAELKVLPFGTPTASLSKYVRAVLEVIKKNKDVTYQVTPMATIVQGPLAKVMTLVQEIHEVPFKMGVNRVLTSVVIDDRRDKAITMESKVKAVTQEYNWDIRLLQEIASGDLPPKQFSLCELRQSKS